eukprot:7346304-Prymnesium_polylepis.1
MAPPLCAELEGAVDGVQAGFAQVDSFSKCCALCSKTPECRLYTYVSEQRHCLLYSSSTGLHREHGA